MGIDDGNCPPTIMDRANVSIIQACENMWDFRNEGAHHENGVPKKNKGETPAWELPRRYRQRSLVFTAKKPRINFPIILGRDTITVQPRKPGWSAKNVSKIPRPPPMGKGVWRCWPGGDRFMGLVPDLQGTP